MQLIRGMKAAEEKNQLEAQGLAGWAMKLIKERRFLRETNERQMRVEETLPLGGKRQLMLISCAGERFLVGGSTESIEVVVPVRPAASWDEDKNMDVQCK